MEIQYKLIGFLNMFRIVPDFVLPVFEADGKLYFQEGEFDVIKSFSIAKESIINNIIPLDSNSKNIFLLIILTFLLSLFMHFKIAKVI